MKIHNRKDFDKFVKENMEDTEPDSIEGFWNSIKILLPVNEAEKEESFPFNYVEIEFQETDFSELTDKEVRETPDGFFIIKVPMRVD